MPAASPLLPSMAQLADSDRLGDLLDHPALASFSRLLLPRSDVEVDRTAPG